VHKKDVIAQQIHTQMC